MSAANGNKRVLAELAKLNRLISDAVGNNRSAVIGSDSEDRQADDPFKAGFHRIVPDELRTRAASAAKAYIKARRARDRLFPADLFGEAAWDILLDLYVKQVEDHRVSVSSSCLAAGVAPTTALRWVNKLLDANLIVRTDDPDDRRRTYLTLAGDTGSRVEQWILATLPQCETDSPASVLNDIARHDQIYRHTP